MQLALSIMEEQAAKLTRRSAGLPAIITGILLGNPSSDLFGEAVSSLQKMAEAPLEYDASRGLRLPQVHALNCLKDIFTNSKLGLSSETYLSSTLVIAARCLHSEM